MFNGAVRQQKHFEVTYWWHGGCTAFGLVRADDGGRVGIWSCIMERFVAETFKFSHVAMSTKLPENIVRISSEMHF